MVYNYNNQPEDGKVVWASAYAKGYNEKSTMLLKLPIKGVIQGDYFYELKKDGTPRKSPRVYSHSRWYSDTESGSIEQYNYQVNRQLRILKQLMDNCEADLIKGVLNNEN